MEEEISAWCLGNGLVMKNAEMQVVHAPVSLFPTVIPQKQFVKIQELAPIFNKLVDRYARDDAFLLDSLKTVIEVDDFTRRLVEIYKKVLENGIAQPIYLGFHRSDYFLQGNDRFLQVEINTISSSFGSLSSKVTKLHDFLLARHFPDFSRGAPFQLVPNEPIKSLVKACSMACDLYKCDLQKYVIMVVQPNEKNTADQRWVEYLLWENHSIRMIRKTLSQLYSESSVDTSNNLTLNGIDGVAAVVYYRAGYTPTDYPTESEWSARLVVECSSAIKCPSIAYQLAGTKKLQQVLANEGILEKYLSVNDALLIRDCFAGLWPLDEPNSNVIIQQAILNPDLFVLKPQREGGGNNYYNEELKKKLSIMSEVERKEFILMERINPVPFEAKLLRAGIIYNASAVSEIGIFASYIGDGKQEVLNELAGHLVRTKPVGVDEGGVAAGYAYLSSPVLTN